MTTPWQRYQTDLKRESFSHDAAQEEAVLLLQDLYDRLVAEHHGYGSGLKAWTHKLRGLEVEPQIGLYFLGRCGAG